MHCLKDYMVSLIEAQQGLIEIISVCMCVGEPTIRNVGWEEIVFVQAENHRSGRERLPASFKKFAQNAYTAEL